VRFLGAAVLLSLAGCTTPSTDPRVAIVWNRVEDPQPVCESLSGRKSFFHILGCSHWSEPVAQGAPRVCTIYSPEPRTERDTQRFATLGHELMHCFDGNWHDRWGRMNNEPEIKRARPLVAPPVLPTASSGDRS
jgi:hypothetical protein